MPLIGRALGLAIVVSVLQMVLPVFTQVIVDEATFALPLAGVIDLDEERRRLDKELAKAVAEIERFDQKLANPRFLERAPAEVVDEQRSRRAEAEQTRQRLAAARARIAS